MHEIIIDEQEDLSDIEIAALSLPVYWTRLDATLGVYYRIAQYGPYTIGDEMKYHNGTYTIKGFAKHRRYEEDKITFSDPVIVTNTDQYINLNHINQWTHVPAKPR